MYRSTMRSKWSIGYSRPSNIRISKSIFNLDTLQKPFIDNKFIDNNVDSFNVLLIINEFVNFRKLLLFSNNALIHISPGTMQTR